MNYKAPDNSLHSIDAEFAYLLPIGCIQITDSEAESLRPAPPSSIPQVVNMAQARLALLGAGLLVSVNAALAAMTGIEGEAARIEWEFRAYVRRDSNLVVALSSVLGLNAATLDQLFLTASTL